MEKIDIAELAVGKQFSVGTRVERASAQCSETIVKENVKLSKYLMAAGAFLVIMLFAQFGMNILAVTLEKDIFVNAHGTGPQTLQDRTGNPLTMPVALERIEPFEGLALMGPEAWDATTNVALLSEDGTLHGFKLSGWSLEEVKTEVGVYQLTLTTLSGATLTYARHLRPSPAAGAHSPFEWVSSGANIIRIQSPHGGNTLALQEGSGRRLQESPKCNPVKENGACNTLCDDAKDRKACNKLWTDSKEAATFDVECPDKVKDCKKAAKSDKECKPLEERCRASSQSVTDAKKAFDDSVKQKSIKSMSQSAVATAKDGAEMATAGGEMLFMGTLEVGETAANSASNGVSHAAKETKKKLGEAVKASMPNMVQTGLGKAASLWNSR